MAIVSIDRARRLFDYRRGEASSIDIKLHPGADASQARKTIADTLGDGWKVLTREEQHTESYRMIAVEKWISFLMLAFILIIASFNVVSTLSMLIIEKRDNLRTLRALGATPRMAGAIFFWEGWLISMVGGGRHHRRHRAMHGPAASWPHTPPRRSHQAQSGRLPCRGGRERYCGGGGACGPILGP